MELRLTVPRLSIRQASLCWAAKHENGGGTVLLQPPVTAQPYPGALFNSSLPLSLLSKMALSSPQKWDYLHPRN